jgi:hypothetical protein
MAAHEAPARNDAIGRIRSALHAALRWWRIGRHYHPERRYMRGARHGSSAAAGR